MAKRGTLGEGAAPPLLTLRQAVRPVVVAHKILAREQATANVLAEEARTLLRLTEELLRKLGLVHLLTAAAAQPGGDGPPSPQADHLAEAYAQVGLSWARVISSVTELAGLLIEQHDWAAVRLLASLVAQSGEELLARHIETLLEIAQDAAVSAQLASVRFHNAMSPSEIRRAVAVLKALTESPLRGQAIGTRRRFMIHSASVIASHKQSGAAVALAGELYKRDHGICQHPALMDHPEYALPDELFFSQITMILDMCEG